MLSAPGYGLLDFRSPIHVRIKITVDKFDNVCYIDNNKRFLVYLCSQSIDAPIHARFHLDCIRCNQAFALSLTAHIRQTRESY